MVSRSNVWCTAIQARKQLSGTAIRKSLSMWWMRSRDAEADMLIFLGDALRGSGFGFCARWNASTWRSRGRKSCSLSLEIISYCQTSEGAANLFARAFEIIWRNPMAAFWRGAAMILEEVLNKRRCAAGYEHLRSREANARLPGDCAGSHSGAQATEPD